MTRQNGHVDDAAHVAWALANVPPPLKNSDASQESDEGILLGWTHRLTSSDSSDASDSSDTSVSSEHSGEEFEIQRFWPRTDTAGKVLWKPALFKLARFCHDRDDAAQKFEEWKGYVLTRFKAIGLTGEQLSEQWLFARMNVKHPPRIRLKAVLDATYADGAPSWIADRLPQQPRLQLALAFLAKLQAAAYPADDFFISTRDLGKLFGASQSWACNVLKLFVTMDILDVVELGGPRNNKATRYRFTQP